MCLPEGLEDTPFKTMWFVRKFVKIMNLALGFKVNEKSQPFHIHVHIRNLWKFWIRFFSLSLVLFIFRRTKLWSSRWLVGCRMYNGWNVDSFTYNARKYRTTPVNTNRSGKTIYSFCILREIFLIQVTKFKKYNRTPNSGSFIAGLELGIWNWGCHLLHRMTSADDS